MVFDFLRNLGKDEAHSIEKLLNFLSNDLRITEDFIHAHYGIPQLILPGGILIQSLTPNNRVMVLGNVRARAAELEKKPIQVYPVALGFGYDEWLNLLLYPAELQVPLLMRASHLKPTFDLKELGFKQWEHMPSYAEFITRHAEVFEQDSLIKPKIPLLQHNNYLYPNIISMIHGNAKHLLNKILFEGDGSNGAGGILKGIRDSFFGISGRTSIKTFFIDSIEGSNDIGPLLKTIQKISQAEVGAPLLVQIPADWALITLQQVFIETYYKEIGGTIILLSFVIQNKEGLKTAWGFRLEDPEHKGQIEPWNFEEQSVREYEKFYNDTKLEMMTKSASPMLERFQKLPHAQPQEVMQVYAHITINTGSVGIKDVFNKRITIPKETTISINELIDAVAAQALKGFDFYPRYATKSLVINGKKMDPSAKYPTTQLPASANQQRDTLQLYVGFPRATVNSADVVIKLKNEGQPDVQAATIGEYALEMPSGTMTGSQLMKYLITTIGADLTRHENKARAIDLYKQDAQLEKIESAKRYNLGTKGEVHSFVIMITYPSL
jgi:hypothetical protein